MQYMLFYAGNKNSNLESMLELHLERAQASLISDYLKTSEGFEVAIKFKDEAEVNSFSRLLLELSKQVQQEIRLIPVYSL